MVAWLGGWRILTTWPHEPKPSSPKCSRSWMLLWYLHRSIVMMPVNFMISCSQSPENTSVTTQLGQQDHTTPFAPRFIASSNL